MRICNNQLSEKRKHGLMHITLSCRTFSLEFLSQKKKKERKKEKKKRNEKSKDEISSRVTKTRHSPALTTSSKQETNERQPHYRRNTAG